MASKPDITLSCNGKKYGVFLANGVSSIQESSAEESTFNARFSRGKKKYGDDPLLNLWESRDWTGGRGNQNAEDDASAFYDSLAWTLSPGVVVPAPKWKIAKGLRNENRKMPGDVTWRPLLSGTRYCSNIFTASASYNATNIFLFVRRIGSPGTLTLNLHSDSADSPGTILKTVTKTISDITDYVDEFIVFTPSSAQAVVSGTNYHISINGGQNDNGDNHWEIGVDRKTPGGKYSTNGITWSDGDFTIYYRITDAHASKRFLFNTIESGIYATTIPGSGNSAFYKFDGTDTFSAYGGTSGLGVVTGRPCFSGGTIYFPQGESVNIRKYTYSAGSPAWADEGTNKATLLAQYGANVARANVSTSATTVSIAPSGTAPLVFATAISCGDGFYPIVNIITHSNKLYVFKHNEIGIIYNNGYSIQESSMAKFPSARNGAAACSWNGLLYFSALNTMFEDYSGNANDVGQAWRGKGLILGRSGAISSILAVGGWRFCAIDAGASGRSSVHVFNGQTWHEIYRAPYGHRIRDLGWLYVDGGKSMLFVDIDYDIVYLTFPTDVANPLRDTTHEYAHSFYLTTSTFDDGAARLAKYFKSITLSTTNCGQLADKRAWFEVDYQTDDKCGMEGATNWRSAGRVYSSPEGTIRFNLGNKRAMRLRIRGYTDTSTIPPELDAITVDGFTRTPARTIWTMKIKIGESGAYKKRASELLKFLQEVSTYAGDVTLSSSIPELNGRHVIITRPKVARSLLNKVTLAWTGSMTLSMMDMTE